MGYFINSSKEGCPSDIFWFDANTAINNGGIASVGNSPCLCLATFKYGLGESVLVIEHDFLHLF